MGSRPSQDTRMARALQAQRSLITPWSTVRVRLRRVGFAQITCRARPHTRGDQRQERRGFCGRQGFVDADYIFSQPLQPACVSAERMAKGVELDMRNSIPANQWTATRWNLADCVQRAYDVEGMKVGTVAVGTLVSSCATPINVGCRRM